MGVYKLRGAKLIFMMAAIGLVIVFYIACYITVFVSDTKVSFKSDTRDEFARINILSQNPYISTTEKNISRHVIFAARKQHVIDQCTREGITPPTSLMESNLIDRMIYESTYNIIYCPVQKVGSSFWKKIIRAISADIQSPFKISGQNVGNFRVGIMRRNNQLTFDKIQEKNGTSLLVVRDPYTKLFSGYVDKLYNSNYQFWENTGLNIVDLVTNRSNSCGHDVTFAEFIKYLVVSYKQDLKINDHFRLTSKNCNPCYMKYDYINKIETFKDDLFYILNEWRREFNISINFADYNKESAIDIARKHIIFSYQTAIKTANNGKCNIKSINFFHRTWRFLQITGIIPKEIDMPRALGNVNNATVNLFYLTVKDILTGNINWTAVKLQRHEALVQAYQTVDADDMELLQKMVKPDSVYFQYNERPAELFDKSSKPVKSGFYYFDSSN